MAKFLFYKLFYPEFLKVNLYLGLKGSSAETDYIIEKDGKIIPIEVKNGKSGKLKSLYLLLKTFPNVQYAYVLTEDKYGEIPEQKIIFRPLFCAETLISGFVPEKIYGWLSVSVHKL